MKHETNSFSSSFSIYDVHNYLNFFYSFGYVVIDDVISYNDCDNTISEIWKLSTKLSNNSIQQYNPDSWDINWPTNKSGILGRSVVNDDMAWKNRQSKHVQTIFSNIYKTNDLIVTLDRYNISRPTKNIQFSNGIISDKKEWKGYDSWFHFDMNPWIWNNILPNEQPRIPYEKHGLLTKHNLHKLITEINDISNIIPIKCQGLIALDDTPIETGGFQCIPGFIGNKVKQWALDNIDLGKIHKNKNFVMIPKDDKMLSQAKVIGIRKGSLLIWNNELPHCNKCNNSNKFRYCQYISMLPREVIHDIEGRKKVIQTILSTRSKSLDNISPVLGLKEELNIFSRLYTWITNYN